MIQPTTSRQPADTGDETLVRMSAAPGLVAEIRGDRPAIATVYRWRERGLHGVRLRTAFAGGERRTCRKWVQEFFAAVTAAVDGDQASSLPCNETRSARRSREVAAAASTLEAAGI